MEIYLYTPNIFHLGAGINVRKTYFYFLKLTKKYFIFLDQKSSIKNKNIHVTQQIET